MQLSLYFEGYINQFKRWISCPECGNKFTPTRIALHVWRSFEYSEKFDSVQSSNNYQTYSYIWCFRYANQSLLAASGWFSFQTLMSIHVLYKPLILSLSSSSIVCFLSATHSSLQALMNSTNVHILTAPSPLSRGKGFSLCCLNDTIDCHVPKHMILFWIHGLDRFAVPFVA